MTINKCLVIPGQVAIILSLCASEMCLWCDAVVPELCSCMLCVRDACAFVRVGQAVG